MPGRVPRRIKNVNNMKTIETIGEGVPPADPQAEPPANDGIGKQMQPPTWTQLNHVQAIMERDTALSRFLGPKTHLVKKKTGEQVGFSPETAAVIQGFCDDNKDAAKATKFDVFSMANNVLKLKKTKTLTGEAASTGTADAVAVTNTTEPDTLPDQPQKEAAMEKGKQTLASILKRIALDQIDLKAGTESRQLNQEVVEEYTEAWKHKAKFPRIQVCHEGKEGGMYYLAEGSHRVVSAKKAGLTMIDAEVFPGGRLEALEKSLGSNQTHGHRRTAADKEYAVKKALVEFSDRSDRMIATMCGVSATFVGKCRKAGEQATTVHVDSSEEGKPKKRRGRDGKERKVSKRSKPPKKQEAAEDAQSTKPTAQEAASEADGGAGQTDRISGLRQLVSEVQSGLASALEENLQQGVTEILREHLVWCRSKWTMLSGNGDWPADPDHRPLGAVR